MIKVLTLLCSKIVLSALTPAVKNVYTEVHLLVLVAPAKETLSCVKQEDNALRNRRRALK